jgi:hypothetical protein
MQELSNIRGLEFNKPQARALTVMANEIWCPWARATGKTTVLGVNWCLHKVEVMPGSIGGLVCTSFEDWKNKISQPFFAGLQMMGYKDGEDYCYGKRPPADWQKPLLPIIDFKNVISFPNGTCIIIISLFMKGSANGLSLQWLYVPEVKLMKEGQLRSEVFPILRGLYKEYGKSPWYGAKLMETDKYAPDIYWILEKQKLHDEKKVMAVLYWQLQYNELRGKLLTAPESTANKYKRTMRAIQALLDTLRRDLVYYGEANALDNIENIGEAYIENMRRSLTDYEFRISILNENPMKVEKSFYPGRNDNHLYCMDKDDDVSKPLVVALDYQASISPLVACQFSERVTGKRTLNFLQAHYVLQPLGLRHVVDAFCEANKLRPCKEVIYLYDHTAVAKDSVRNPYWVEVEDAFKKNGWSIRSIYMGAAPGHSEKYRKMDHWFAEDTDTTVPIRMHKIHCAHMIMSMDMAGLKNNAGIEKDKSTEKKKNYPQHLATHFSDVFDQLAWGLLEQKLYSGHTVSTGDVALR